VPACRQIDKYRDNLKVNLRQRCGFLPNYFEHMTTLMLAACSGERLCNGTVSVRPSIRLSRLSIAAPCSPDAGARAHQCGLGGVVE